MTRRTPQFHVRKDLLVKRQIIPRYRLVEKGFCVNLRPKGLRHLRPFLN